LRSSRGSDTLAFSRYYNSLSSLTSALGIGWRTTFDRQIIGLNGTLSPGQTLLLLRPDGAVYQFDPTSGGGYVSHESDNDGSLATDGASIWTFTDRGATVETYDFHSGKLLSIRTRSGYQQTLQYDASGHLASVSDSYGRTLTFTFANGVLRSMTDPDGRVYGYGYTAGLPVTAAAVVVVPVNPDRLAQVTYPDNSVRQYVYEDTRFPYR
jgi:YD repeat-containing protein